MGIKPTSDCWDTRGIPDKAARQLHLLTNLNRFRIRYINMYHIMYFNVFPLKIFPSDSFWNMRYITFYKLKHVSLCHLLPFWQEHLFNTLTINNTCSSSCKMKSSQLFLITAGVPFKQFVKTTHILKFSTILGIFSKHTHTDKNMYSHCITQKFILILFGTQIHWQHSLSTFRWRTLYKHTKYKPVRSNVDTYSTAICGAIKAWLLFPKDLHHLSQFCFPFGPLHTLHHYHAFIDMQNQIYHGCKRSKLSITQSHQHTQVGLFSSFFRYTAKLVVAITVVSSFKKFIYFFIR